MKAPTIICDFGEQRSGIPARLRGLGITVEVKRLDTGDYVVSGAMAVERKSSADFARSVVSGRLLPQLDLLASTYDVAVLLIEGDKWEGDRSLKTPMLARLFQQITFSGKIFPWYSPDEKHTARLLAGLARQEQASKVCEAIALPAMRNARTPQDVLRALPGVEEATAKKLLARFPSVAAVMTASRADLQQTIGKKRGEDLFDLLNRTS